MKNVILTIVAAAAVSMGTSAHAGDVVELIVDVDGWESASLFGDAGNTSATFDIGADAHVVGVAWDITLQTFGESLANEALFWFGSTSAPQTLGGLLVNIAAPMAAPAQFTGSADLIAIERDFFVGADGLLNIEAAEFVATAPGVESLWDGTLTISYIPVPAPAGLAVLGLLAIGRRRRD